MNQRPLEKADHHGNDDRDHPALLRGYGGNTHTDVPDDSIDFLSIPIRLVPQRQFNLIDTFSQSLLNFRDSVLVLLTAHIPHPVAGVSGILGAALALQFIQLWVAG
jgi:hypothetical protein